MTHVPFQGAAPALTALIGGHVDLMIGSPLAAYTNEPAGKVKVLGVAATERAFEIVAELEDVLRDDGSLSQTGRFAQVAGPFRLEEMSSDTARAAQVTVSVAVRARI